MKAVETTRAERAVLLKADLIEEVSGVVEVAKKEAAIIVELIFDKMVRALRSGEKVELVPHRKMGIGIEVALHQQGDALGHRLVIVKSDPPTEPPKRLRCAEGFPTPKRLLSQVLAPPTRLSR